MEKTSQLSRNENTLSSQSKSRSLQFFGLACFVGCALFLFSDWPYYYTVSVSLLVFTFFDFIDALGKKLPLGEFLSFSAAAFWLVTPIPIKEIYNFTALAVPAESYYSYALPATIAMIIGMKIPMKQQVDVSILVKRMEDYLSQPKNKKLQWILLTIGVVAGFLINFIPQGIAFFVFLLSQLIYVSSLYSIFTPSLSKTLIIVVTLGITMIIVILSGMFGQLIWWGLCGLMILALKYKFNLTKKLIAVALGIVFITAIQQIKLGYRKKTWTGGNTYASIDRTEAFGNEVSKTFSSDQLISKQSFAVILVRANQAFLSSLVLRHVPARQPHTNGATLATSLFAGFIPRFLWPDKPKSGGLENMNRFAGVKLRKVSMDIGNIMDGYIDFGRTGGIIYMFMYGLLINYLLSILLAQHNKFSPTILLWAPFVFIQVLKVETSFDTTFNAAIKGLFFVWLIFFLFRRLFNIRL